MRSLLSRFGRRRLHSTLFQPGSFPLLPSSARFICNRNYTTITDIDNCVVEKNCVPHQGNSDALCLGREANAWYLKTVPFDGTASCSVLDAALELQFGGRELIEYALIEQNEECEISYNAKHGLPFPNFTAPEDWWQHTFAPGSLEFCYHERMPLAPWHQKQLSLNYTVFTNFDDGSEGSEQIRYCELKINCMAVIGDDGLCFGPQVNTAYLQDLVFDGTQSCPVVQAAMSLLHPELMDRDELVDPKSICEQRFHDAQHSGSTVPSLAVDKDEHKADGTPASTAHSTTTTSSSNGVGNHHGGSYSSGFLLSMIAAVATALVPAVILGLWYHHRRRRRCTVPATIQKC
jgi:hypothetical protein